MISRKAAASSGGNSPSSRAVSRVSSASRGGLRMSGFTKGLRTSASEAVADVQRRSSACRIADLQSARRYRCPCAWELPTHRRLKICDTADYKSALRYLRVSGLIRIQDIGFRVSSRHDSKFDLQSARRYRCPRAWELPTHRRLKICDTADYKSALRYLRVSRLMRIQDIGFRVSSRHDSKFDLQSARRYRCPRAWELPTHRRLKICDTADYKSALRYLRVSRLM